MAAPSVDYRSVLERNSFGDAPFVLVGRSLSSDIVVDDPTVSRSHLCLAKIGGNMFFAIDLGSSAGSFVERAGEWVPFTENPLGHDQRIKLGRVVVQVQMLWSPQPAEAPSIEVVADTPASATETVVVLRRNAQTGRVEKVTRPKETS